MPRHYRRIRDVLVVRGRNRGQRVADLGAFIPEIERRAGEHTQRHGRINRRRLCPRRDTRTGHKRDTGCRLILQHFDFFGVPKGIRTPVTAVKEL